VLSALFTFLAGSFGSRTALQIEILALRHQLNVLQRSWNDHDWAPQIAGSGLRCPAGGRNGVVLAHQRRRILHFAVTQHPTAEWTAQQLREAFPWDTAVRFLLRDRDRIFGQEFVEQAQAMGIEEVLSTPRSPWQRAYVERLIGTIRRECLDHVIVFSEISLRRHLQGFTDYYHRSRTHLSLQKDTPEPRPIQPPSAGQIIAVPEVGGLHHRYERHTA
jgi:putative transposase